MYHLILTDADWVVLAKTLGLTPYPMPRATVWRVGNDTFVHRDRVAEYVVSDPELQRHAQTILYNDWPDMGEHLAWVYESPPADVSDWARSIERDAE